MTIDFVHLRSVFTPFTHRPWSAILSHETGAQKSTGCHQISEALGAASENGSSGPSPMQRPYHTVSTPLQMLNGQDLREEPSLRITAWLGSIEMYGRHDRGPVLPNTELSPSRLWLFLIVLPGMAEISPWLRIGE
nr:hypothetical protein CFP56_09033 [Quercus suber]